MSATWPATLSGDGGLSRHERLRRDRNVRRWVDKPHRDVQDVAVTGSARRRQGVDGVQCHRRRRPRRQPTTTTNAAGINSRADAIVDHITRQGTAGEGAGGSGETAQGAEVSVLIDYTALLHGGAARVAETADGQPLPVEVIRRLGCDGTLVPIWLSGDHEVLAVGRHCRLATRAQRRALRAMYRTCAFPHCTVGFEHCRIHHVTYWEHFGRTDLDNLIPTLRTPPPPRPRRRLDTRVARRATNHIAAPRRHPLLRRRHHQPHHRADSRRHRRARRSQQSVPAESPAGASGRHRRRSNEIAEHLQLALEDVRANSP